MPFRTQGAVYAIKGFNKPQFHLTTKLMHEKTKEEVIVEKDINVNNHLGRFEECCYTTGKKEGFRLIWEVTHFCPNSCEYCMTWSSPRRKVFECDINLLMKRIQTLIDTTYINEVLIGGGEPLLTLKKISPFLTFLRKKGIKYSFSSTIFNMDMFLKVADYKPHVIYLAMDPPNRNDATFFKSLYEETEEKISRLDEAEIPIKLVAVVNRDNYEGIPVLLSKLSYLLPKYRNIPRIAFCREYQIGSAAVSLPLTQKELSGIFNIIQEWSKTISVPVTYINHDMFNYPLSHCPGGSNIMSILPNADVAPCPLLYRLSRNYRVGNINIDPIGDILDRLNTFSVRAKEYRKLTEKNTKECSTCEVKSDCGGGCLVSLPIASNHIAKRTCERSPDRLPDHERKLIADFHYNMRKGYSPNIKLIAAPKPMLPKDIEKDIREHVLKNIKSADLSHSMEHVDSVVSLSKYISKKEGASTKITIPAAYFLDIAPLGSSNGYMQPFNSAAVAEDFLLKTGYFTEDEVFYIQNAIYTSFYSSYLLGYDPISLESKVVRDANWLDSIGARGIARAFSSKQTNGVKLIGYPEFNPEEFIVSVDMNIIESNGTPIHQFYTKLLKIYALLQTPSGKEIGRKRHQFMVDFLNHYKDEVDTGRVQ